MLQRGIRMFRLPPKSIQIKRSTAPFDGLRGNLTPSGQWSDSVAAAKSSVREKKPAIGRRRMTAMPTRPITRRWFLDRRWSGPPEGRSQKLRGLAFAGQSLVD
jgi:hypothetical protein